MTTIAFDGNVLAADRLMSGCALPVAIKKIRRTGDGRLLGGCGSAVAMLAMMDWLAALPKDRRHRPKFRVDDDDFVVLEIFKNRKIIEHLNAGSLPVRAKKYAVGSGREYAIMAMHCGCTAVNAVKHTAKFDPYTGLGVDFLRLD